MSLASIELTVQLFKGLATRLDLRNDPEKGLEAGFYGGEAARCAVHWDRISGMDNDVSEHGKYHNLVLPGLKLA